MSEIEKLFLKAWRQEDYQADEELPEYIELPKEDFLRILIEADNKLERICLESKEIIEGFHKLLEVHSSTEALAKTAVLMREEEDLQNDILSTFVNFCWTHYWDTFANDVPIIMDHIESIIEFVKSDIKKRRG